jgi:hypothetical protein
VLNFGPRKGLISDFKYLLDSKHFADVKIKIGEETMLVHKAVLIGTDKVRLST